MRRLRDLIRNVASAPALQPLSILACELRSRPRRRHPFDLRHGIDTGGVLPGSLLRPDGRAGDQTAYLGCVPSALTRALGAIGSVKGATFVDLGCGKGRALAVARVFPFARILGVEMNPRLVAAARRNAAIIRRAGPGAPPIEIVCGDASAPAPVTGDAVFFLYHPFGEASMTRLCANLAARAEPSRRLFVIYENPVHGHVFDAEPAFHRWFAATLPYAAEEVSHGPDESETIAIWANAAAGPTPHEADGRIVVTKPGWRADIAPNPRTE
jgi:SAM-dependent methyltransferase